MNVPKGERYELCVAVHAEQNALINADPNKMKNATLYIAGFNADGSAADGKPCLLCRRMIRNAGIAKVFCFDENKKLCLQQYNLADDKDE